MPIFQIEGDSLSELVRLAPGPDLYEHEIEDLLWSNLEAFVGDDLFPVCRQRKVRSGGIPDVVALDIVGRVVVIEVKRSIERTQLAQCLEYAGWARQTNLDELAGLYDEGSAAFFENWQEFTGSSTPTVVNPAPRVVLVAAEFDDRTADALDFLSDSDTPVERIPVSMYRDSGGDRFVHIDTETEAVAVEPVAPQPAVRVTQYRIHGRRFGISDLLEAGLVEPGEHLVLERKKDGVTFEASITAEGLIDVDGLGAYETPSRAASEASGLAAVPGWEVWRAPARGNKTLFELRDEALAAEAGGVDA